MFMYIALMNQTHNKLLISSKSMDSDEFWGGIARVQSDGERAGPSEDNKIHERKEN